MGRVIVLMGVSGSGKTTVGHRLAEKTGGEFIEGDAYHPLENVEKMRSGRPLNDTDRKGWLEALADVIREKSGEPGWSFLGCSALKKQYRDILRRGDAQLEFVYLKGEETVLRERLQSRKGHFMPAGLLDSQLETLEEPEEAVWVSIDQEPESMVNEILRKLDSAEADRPIEE